MSLIPFGSIISAPKSRHAKNSRPSFRTPHVSTIASPAEAPTMASARSRQSLFCWTTKRVPTVERPSIVPSGFTRTVARLSEMNTGLPSGLRSGLRSSSTAITLVRATSKSACAAASIASAVWRPAIGCPSLCQGISLSA